MSKKKHTSNELPPVDFDQVDQVITGFRSRYSAPRRVILDLSGQESMTKQSFKDESNINNIVNKYLRTGILPDTSRAALAKWGDFSEIPDYKEALDTVLIAQEAFGELPSSLRNRFNNDPAELLAFVQDAGNREEAIALGLIEAPAKGEQSDPPAAVVPAPKGAHKGTQSEKTGGEPQGSGA